MKRVRLLGLLLAVSMIFAVLASPGGVHASDSYYDQLQQYVATYNSSISMVPGPLRFILQDQRVAMHFESAVGPEEVVGVVTDEQAVITGYLQSAPDNLTLRIRVSEGTVPRLIDENSGYAVLRAIGEDIRFEGVGIIGRIKTMILHLAGTVARMFGG